MSKNVLVTGGSGFIGSHIVDLLLKKKYKVTILDTKNPHRKDVRFIKGSITNESIINSSLRNINYVFHLAAVSDINKVGKIPTKTVETNILGTSYLLEASRKAKVKRFIFAGSVYSLGGAGNIYTTSKTASELLIKNYQLLFKQNYTILRFSTAYGPRSREADVISIFVKQAMKNLNLIVHGNGKQKRNFVYVKDLAKGAMLAFKKNTNNKILTIASKKNINIFNLAKMIIGITKSKSKIVCKKNKKRIDDFNFIFTLKNKKNLVNCFFERSIINGIKNYINEKKF